MDQQDWELVSEKDFTPEIIDALDKVRKDIRSKKHTLVSEPRVYRSKNSAGLKIIYDEI